jgi:uncharacterized protein DUF4054
MAFEITWEDVVNTAQDIADELEEFTTAQRDLVINMTNRRVSEKRFSDDTFDARRYYAAHWANMSITPPAGEGTRASESIGSVSTGVTLAVNNPPPDKHILETQFGRSYWHIMQTRYEAFYVG